MKKTRGAKRKVTHHAKKQNSGSSFFKRFFPVFLIVAALLIGSILLNYTRPTGHALADTGTNFVENLFSGWTAGNLDVNLSKILFWIMLLMIIGDVLNVVGFPSNGFLQFGLALIVSFLASAYITPNEVYVMLTSYSALGLALGTVIPFMIIMFTSAVLASAKKVTQLSTGRLMLIVVLWFLWTGFLIYRLIMFAATSGIMALITGGGIVISLVAVASILILIFNKAFRKWLQDLGIETMTNRARVEQAQRKLAIKTQKSAEEAQRGGSNI
jgi:hypothetical protein